MAPGPPSTCPRAAEVSSRVSPSLSPAALGRQVTYYRWEGERLLFKRPRKLRHPHWRVPRAPASRRRAPPLEQPRPRPCLLPAGGRGAGRRWKGSNFPSKWDRSDRIRFPGQHSTFHPSPAFASQRQQPGKPAGYRTTAPNSQIHTHRHRTRALEGLRNLQSRGAPCTFSGGPSDTTPPQFADGAKGCNPFLSSWLIGSLVYQRNSFLISPIKGFTLHKQSRYK